MVGLAVSRSVAPTMRAIAPSLAIAPSRSGECRIEAVAGLLGDGAEELLHGVGEHERELVTAQAGDGLGDGGDGVVVVHHRAVAGAAAGRQPHPGQPFSAVSIR